MILPILYRQAEVNKKATHIGIDHPEVYRKRKVDLDAVARFPLEISYQFNSRGFRGPEWPSDVKSLTESIWVIGSSYAMSVGLPEEYMLSLRIKEHLNESAIDASAGGVSNEWIRDRAQYIIDTLHPEELVIHWTLLHVRDDIDRLNRELEQQWQNYYQAIKDPSWPAVSRDHISSLPNNILDELQSSDDYYRSLCLSDDDRINLVLRVSIAEGTPILFECIKHIEQHKQNTRVYHVLPPITEETDPYYPDLEHSITNISPGVILVPTVKRVDLARDQYHYGPISSRNLVNNLIDTMKKYQSS
jgi:hypothetical protein